MQWLQTHGSQQTRKVLRRHGARDPLYGVKISDLKKILRGNRNNQVLATALWDTGNSDAMYLAALMADSNRMSKNMLRQWMKAAYWYMLSESAVAALAAESAFGWELGIEWSASTDETIAAGGWAALSAWISIRPDSQLDFALIRTHLAHIKAHIHTERNRVRYGMNTYVISVAAYAADLYQDAQAVAHAIGKVHVNMGDTSCKVPLATAYIEKIARMQRVGKKRPHARC